MKRKTIYDVMKMNTVIYKLIQQEINYTVSIAYKLYKLKKELDEIEQLMIERWTLLFGENYNIENFNNEQILAYNATLMSEVDIDIFNLNIDEITINNTVSLSIDDVETIDAFLT